jgi:hypothetical protein
VAISVVIALAASLAALWLTFRLRHEAAQVVLMRWGRHHDGHCHCRYALCRDESRTVSDVDDGSPCWY